jgi:hypothetical protein
VDVARTSTDALTVVDGYEVSEGFIPQERELFWVVADRDAAAESVLRHEVTRRDWRDFVVTTASANFVDAETPSGWRERWSSSDAATWLVAFNYVSDGDDFELRLFEAVIR